MIALGVFFASWWKAGVGILVGAAIAWPIAGWLGERHEKHLEAAQEAVAIAGALATDSKGKEQAAAERLTDATVVAAKQKELTNAVSDLADETPSLRDVQLACARLRQQGTDVSGVPQCSGSAGGAKAPAPNLGPGK